MTEILQRTLDPGVAPARILTGHPHHQTANVLENPRAGLAVATDTSTSVR